MWTSEVKMETYRHLNGHQFTIIKVAGSCLFRSLALLLKDETRCNERKSHGVSMKNWNDLYEFVRGGRKPCGVCLLIVKKST
jgi:hypothetical protein